MFRDLHYCRVFWGFILYAMMLQTQAEEDIQKLRGKIQSLQVDLDNSEAVQRDFVKLSQSLQVTLNLVQP